MERIFQGLNRKKAELILVILASQSIKASLEKDSTGKCMIFVSPHDLPNALYHLAQYNIENQLKENKTLEPVLPASPFFSPAALVIMVLVSLIHMVSINAGTHEASLFRFGISPYFLSQGDTYRAITALFFHADTAHLLGNLAGLLVFASPMIRLTGYGSGPFFLLCAAATGNLISNGLEQNAVLSIGASTAVMGAAGLLAAWQVCSNPFVSMFKRLVPLAAGATLMAMFSQGERTDVSAHFFGFMSGIGVGFLVFPLFKTWYRPFMEKLFLILVLTIICSAALTGFQ